MMPDPEQPLRRIDDARHGFRAGGGDQDALDVRDAGQARLQRADRDDHEIVLIPAEPGLPLGREDPDDLKRDVLDDHRGSDGAAGREEVLGDRGAQDGRLRHIGDAVMQEYSAGRVTSLSDDEVERLVDSAFESIPHRMV